MSLKLKQWQDGPIVKGPLLDHLQTYRQVHFDLVEPSWPKCLSDPFLLKDMKKATKRLWSAIEKKEKIAIVGDYDMDGTPAAALLYEFFRLFGQTPVVVLPTRKDGYGFTTEQVDQLVAGDLKLIITVDCGISSH